MQESKLKVKALDQGNCATARLGGEEAYVKAASPRTEMCFEADGGDELVPHSEILDSLPEVKHGVVQSKFTSLPGETCSPRGWPRERSGSTVAGNGGGTRIGVSRGRSNAGYDPGVGVHPIWGELNEPHGLTNARRTELIGTAGPRWPFVLTMSRTERPRAAEKDRNQSGVLRRAPIITRSQRTSSAEATPKPETKR